MSAKKSNGGNRGLPQFRIKEGGPWSGAWKIAAGVGVLGLIGAGAGYASDHTRFAFSYLFAFFVVLTIALGSLFFILVHHLTGAGWSVTVRRTAEFYASGLPAFALLVLPILGSMSMLYPWVSHATHGAAAGEHSSTLTLLESTATAQEHNPTSAPRTRGHAEAEQGHMEHGSVPTIAHGESAIASEHGGYNAEEALEQAERHEHAEVMAGKRGYLNVPFFLLRAVLFVGIWSFLALRYFRLSTAQDRTRDLANTVAAQRLAPLATILFALSLTFAGIDWLMALDPMWYSTMWGVYVFAAGVVSMFAVLILTSVALRNSGLVGDAINTEHFHDLGKLQFGWLVFWAYIAFAQFFLIWYSNIPEELTFFHLRWTANGGAWKPVSLLLFLGHFVLPFAVLLSRNAKRNAALLPLGAAIILIMHVVEMYWVVMPNYGAGRFALHWMDLACLMAVGGIYLAVVFRNMTQYSLIPVGDPRLDRSLNFENA